MAVFDSRHCCCAGHVIVDQSRLRLESVKKQMLIVLKELMSFSFCVSCFKQTGTLRKTELGNAETKLGKVAKLCWYKHTNLHAQKVNLVGTTSQLAWLS